MKHLLLLLIALCIGGLLPVQGAINTQLGKILNHPMQATFVSFFGALIAIVIYLAIARPEMPSLATLKTTPLINFSGGLFGVVFVTAILMVTPQIGIGNTIVAAIVGQLIVSIFLDHFGLLGLDRYPINTYRALGCIGLVLSLWLIQKT